MSAKRLLCMVVPLFFACAAGQELFAQINEVGVTYGKTFVSTQTVYNSGFADNYNPPVHFGNEETVGFNYSRLMLEKGLFGLRLEVPGAYFPSMDLNFAANVIPRHMGALFVTPSARVNFFTRDNVTPWVSAGGGYGHFWYSSSLLFYGTNPGPLGSNTGVLQVGAGLDVWVWRNWAGRGEVRDFYSGEPDLHVDTNRSREHNYYVGFGVVRRF